MTIKKYYILILLVSAIIAFFIGCEADNPASIYDPEVKGEATPEILSMLPADSILAGVGEIEINGRNFSSNPEENFVFFDTEKVPVIEASESQLTIKSPVNPADSIVVKVAVHGAFNFSNEVVYKLLSLFWVWGEFDDYDDAYGIAMDLEDNLYVSLAGKKIVQVTPDGKEQPYCDILVDKASAMKMGPGGYLYYVNILQYMFRIPPGGGTSEFFATLPGGVFDLDFDSHGNLYCGGSGNAIYTVRPDGSNEATADYPSVYIKSIRVFNDYVYVAGKYSGDDSAEVQEAVWRNQILSAEGTLGPNELVFDWSNSAGARGYNIQSITFSVDGELYIGTNAPEAIIVLDSEGSARSLYPGVLEPETYAMTWGNGAHLYINRRNDDASKKRMIKLNMLKQGAPYYGRGL